MTVSLQETIEGTLASEVRTADGRVTIPAGAAVRFAFDPDCSVGVHPIGGAEGVVASFRELLGSEVRDND